MSSEKDTPKSGPAIVRRRQPQATKPSPLSEEMAKSLRLSDGAKASRAETKPTPSDLLEVEIETSQPEDVDDVAATSTLRGSSQGLESNEAPPESADLDSVAGSATYTGPPEKISVRLVPAVVIAAIGLAAVGGTVWILTKNNSAPPAQTASTEIVSSDPTSDPSSDPSSSDPTSDAVGELIKVADAKFISGQITGESGALAILLKAKADRPDDERIILRLMPLADKFQELGEAALKSGRLADAATHFQTSLDADPTRDEVAKKLADVKTQL